ncbi:MAG: DUF2269 domain-containing protein [Phycisphaerae bacterium]|nr:DUF2269 domain-containing protein [Gemmatimonadaceae bacterium]
MTYTLWKFLHVLGVVLLIGNVTVTAVWKVFADRTGAASVVAFAQRLVTYTDWAFTLGGVTLLIIGGYGMALQARLSLFSSTWLSLGQLMFVISGLIWILILVPTQIRQSRMTRTFTSETVVLPDGYRVLSRRWIFWGVVATLPLLVALYLMVAKL